MERIGEISFSELRNAEQFNDSNSIVLVSTLFRNEDDVDSTENAFHKIGLIAKDRKIKKCYFITGNVRGDARNGADSRSDYLVELEDSATNNEISPMVRLNYGNTVKWTSDFIDNFKHDYHA